MSKYLAQGVSCVVPETVNGLPVTEIADRAFAKSAVEQVYLPPSVKRIGRYAFYGCENLRELEVFAGATEIGGGVFNGCQKLRLILFHGSADGRSSLRDFVTELSGRLTVRYFLPGSGPGDDGTGSGAGVESNGRTDSGAGSGTGGENVGGCGGEYEAARLIFPEYYDEAVENTPARLISFAIHGSGQRYRYCFLDKRLQFDKYDKIFGHEQIEEDVVSAAEIALYRLRFPHGLLPEARRDYEAFFTARLEEILFGYLKDTENFKWIFDRFARRAAGDFLGEAPPFSKGEAASLSAGDGPPLSREAADRLAAEAARRKLAEIAGLLADYRHEVFGSQTAEVKKSKFQF